jgi:Mn-dependent DtxR family transcriptional regulator
MPRKIDLEHYGPGRPPLPETRARMEKMIREIEKDPGIRSVKLAKLLGVTSLECATLAKRLRRRGFITVGHKDRALVYYLADEAA